MKSLERLYLVSAAGFFLLLFMAVLYSSTAALMLSLVPFCGVLGSLIAADILRMRQAARSWKIVERALRAHDDEINERVNRLLTPEHREKVVQAALRASRGQPST